MGELSAYSIHSYKQAEFAKNVAKLHAESIVRYIEKLNCPSEQKLALIDSIIATVKNK